MPSKVNLLTDIPQEFLRAIGEVVVSWNYLEQILNYLLIDLLGKDLFDHKPHVVFAHMALPRRLMFLVLSPKRDSNYHNTLC